MKSVFENLMSPQIIRQSQQEFPKRVEASHFHLWKPGDEIVTSGDRLLIGVSIACRYDLRLLDLLDANHNVGGLLHTHIDVFDWEEITLQNMAEYIPFSEMPLGGPLVGLWTDGQLVSTAWGYQGRKLISDRYELPEAYLYPKIVYPTFPQ